MNVEVPHSLVVGYLACVALLWLCAHYWMKRAKTLQKQNDAQHVEILHLRRAALDAQTKSAASAEPAAIEQFDNCAPRKS